MSDKYLSAERIPTVSIYREAPVEDVDTSMQLTSGYGSPPEPSLRGFLRKLEEEKAKAAEGLTAVAMNVDSQDMEESEEPDGHESDDAGAGLAEVPGETAGNATPSLQSDDQKARERFFGTTDPREGGPIFPKPSSFGSSVDRFFKYFPLNADEGTTSEPGTIMLPINSEAIFQPPGTSNMRSSATLREGT